MAQQILDACFFVDEPPEFEYRSGLFHVSYTVGGYHVERVMRPNVFMLAMRRAAECAQKHRLGSAAIIPFEKDAVA